MPEETKPELLRTRLKKDLTCLEFLQKKAYKRSQALGYLGVDLSVNHGQTFPGRRRSFAVVWCHLVVHPHIRAETLTSMV